MVEMTTKIDPSIDPRLRGVLLEDRVIMTQVVIWHVWVLSNRCHSLSHREGSSRDMATISTTVEERRIEGPIRRTMLASKRIKARMVDVEYCRKTTDALGMPTKRKDIMVDSNRHRLVDRVVLLGRLWISSADAGGIVVENKLPDIRRISDRRRKGGE